MTENVHVYLSEGDGPTAGHLDLAAGSYAVLWDGFDAPSPERGQTTRTVRLALDIYGDTVADMWRNWDAIEHLLGRGNRKRREHAHSSHKGLTLGIQLGTDRIVYFDVLEGSLDADGSAIGTFSERVVKGAELRLECLPFARGPKIVTDVSGTLTNGDSATYTTPYIPGTADALVRLLITDVSTNSQVINRVLVGSKSDLVDGTEYDPVVAFSPSGSGSGVSVSDSVAGTVSRVTTSDSWQEVATATQPANVPETYGMMDLWLRLRDHVALGTEPTSLSTSSTPAVIRLQAVQYSGQGASHSISWQKATGDGNFLALKIAIPGASTSVTVPSGWTLAGSQTAANGSTFIYYYSGAPSQSGSIVVSTSSSQRVFIEASEFVGIESDSSPHSGGGTDSQSPGSVSNSEQTAGTGTEITESDGTDSWTFEGETDVDDNVTARALGISEGDISHTLQLSQFGFNVPDGAHVRGIEVDIQRRSDSADDAVWDHTIQLATDDELSDNKAKPSQQWPTTDTVETYGGSTDKWNLTLTPSLVNSGLVLNIRAQNTNEGGSTVGDAHIDYVTVTVYYQASTTLSIATGTRSTQQGLILAVVSSFDSANHGAGIPTSTNTEAVFTVGGIGSNDGYAAGGFQDIASSATSYDAAYTLGPYDYGVGVTASFNAELNTSPSLLPGDYELRVTAIDGDETPASQSVYVTLTVRSAITVDWDAPENGTPTGYRVYWNREETGWFYVDTGSTSTSYQLTSTASGTAGDPPASNSLSGGTSVRVKIGTESGSVTRDIQSVTTKYANGNWELLNVGSVPLPPVPANEGELPESWGVTVEVMHPSQTENFDVDAAWLLPHYEYKVLAKYVDSDGDEMTLATNRIWDVDTRRDGNVTGLLRDTSDDSEAGFVLVEGGLNLSPGVNLLFFHFDAASGVSDVTDLKATVKLEIIPRYRSISGSLT